MLVEPPRPPRSLLCSREDERLLLSSEPEREPEACLAGWLRLDPALSLLLFFDALFIVVSPFFHGGMGALARLI
jgi:hypothetical protein